MPVGTLRPKSNGGFKALIDNSNQGAGTPSADAMGAIVAGPGARATGSNTIVLGKGAYANYEGGISIGTDSRATGSTPSIALGSGQGGVSKAVASAPGSTAIGSGGVTASGNYSVALGNTVTASGAGSVAIGSSASALATDVIAIGTATTTSFSTNGIAIGKSSSNSGADNITIGRSSSAGSGGWVVVDCVVIGREATASTSTSGGRVIIGSQAAGAEYSVTVGYGANTNNAAGWGIAIGTDSNAASPNGRNIAIGVSAYSNSGGNAIAIGRNSTSAGTASVALGYGASASQAGSICFGLDTTSAFAGEFAVQSGGFSAGGDARLSMAVYWMTTTNATATEIGNGGATYTTTPTNRIVLSNDSSYIFDCDIIARNTATDTESSAWNLKFAIRRGAAAANTALIGSATKTLIGQDSGTASWDVSVTANTTNGRPNISVTGEAAKTIRWVANIRMTKVSG